MIEAGPGQAEMQVIGHFYVRMRCQAGCETTNISPPLFPDAQSACPSFPANRTHTRTGSQRPILCAMQAVGGVGVRSDEVEAPSWQESGSVVLDCHWRIFPGTVPGSKIGSIVSSSLSPFGFSFSSINGPDHWKRPVLFARGLLSSGYSCVVIACGEDAAPHSRWTGFFIG